MEHGHQPIGGSSLYTTLADEGDGLSTAFPL